MAKTTTGKNGSFDFSKAFDDFRFPGFDVGAVVEAQRKNIEALTQAHQLAVEGAQALAQRQTRIMQQAFEETSGLLRDLTQPGAPEERMAKSADAARQAFDNRVANVRELNELGVKTGTDVFGVIARRVSESFDEMRLYARRKAAAE